MNELRIGILGNVDSGKTTLISVLKNNKLDNGRGLSRKYVLKHKHEKESGRTSSITNHYFKNDKNILSFIDLAGHEKYYKTTIFGANSSSLDYILLLVGANMGVTRMTIEHLLLTLILKKKFIIVLTKIDICPESVLNQTIKDINKLLEKYKCKKLQFFEKESENITKNKNTLAIKISNVSGLNIDTLKNHLINLNDKNKWEIERNQQLNGVIEDVFFVHGVGIVITGTINKGKIIKGDKIMIGPFKGEFKSVIVKSIHDNFRKHVDFIEAGCSGCFNIKSSDKKFILNKNIIKRGLLILDKDSDEKTYKTFEAKIKILHHPSTIQKNYETMIHCDSIKQTARIIFIENNIARIGDQTKVHFQFIKRPELIKLNKQIMFREGKTKGIGIITKLLD